MGIARRWWPLPVTVALSLLVQTISYTGRYDVSGHASGHLSSGTFVFLAIVVVLGVYLVRSAPARLAGWAAVLKVLVPPWIRPGFEIVAIAIARMVAVERAARSTGGGYAELSLEVSRA